MGILPSGGTTLQSVMCGTLEQMAGGFLLALCPFRWVRFFFNSYLFGCTRSWFQHVGSSIFTVPCGIFSYGVATQLRHAGSSSLTRDQTGALCVGSMESPSHWATRGVPG